MAFDAILSQIQWLLAEIENRPEDRHELLEQIQAELAGLRATGMPVPDDLVELEARLEREFGIAGKNT